MKRYQWRKAFPEMPLSYTERVEATLASLPEEKEVLTMKLKKRFAVPVFALLAMMLIGTGLMATGTLRTLFMSSDSRPTYTEMPTVSELEKNPGFMPVLKDSFKNGYRFESAVVGDSGGQDEFGNDLFEQKFISADYVKGDDRFTLTVEPYNDFIKDQGTVVDSVEGIDLFYSSYMNKFVPGDYELTEQDKKDEASGKYVFAYGADTVSVEKTDYLSWDMDGLSYSLMATDTPLSREDFIVMAKEIIAAE